MDLNKLFDLRFIIGSFFSIVGLLLLIYGFINESSQANSVNRWCGGFFVLFGVVMIILSLQKEAHDELLEQE
jgi:uncharacterized membrane protein